LPGGGILGIKFAARTILELGKELISSDEVAIYELIKNSVDAGSARVDIVAQVIVPSSAHRTSVEMISAGKTPSAVLQFLRSRSISDAPPSPAKSYFDALEACEDDAEEFGTALNELYRQYNWIEVRDEGHGMTGKDLEEVFLTVGTRSRRQANLEGANYLGDKGVGRLSTMRLGDYLNVSTTTEKEAYWNVLDINWSLFGHDTELEIEDIEIAPRRGARKPDRDVHGTTIQVANLTSDWGRPRYAEVFQGRIARMIDPFEPGKANALLRVMFNGARITVPSIPQSLLKSAHATMTAHFEFEGDEPVISGNINYQLRSKSRPISQRGAEIYSIAQNIFRRRGKRGHAATVHEPIRPKALSDLGPFDVEIYWFNRRVVEAVDGLTEKALDTKRQIALWSGGPMLYRRGYRILPYGDPDDDWLELDKNAFGVSGFKLNRQQVVGRVAVDSAHTALNEQTNREGLVRSDSSEALTTIVKWLVHGEMRQLINDADDEEKLTRREAEDKALAFRQTQILVEQAIESLRREIPLAQRPMVDNLAEQIETLTDQCEALVSGIDKLVVEAVEEREKFVHLAGIGLMTEFIFHELDRAVENAMKAIRDAKGAPRQSVLAALESQLVTLQKRVSAFDELTGERRQVKSRFDVADVAQLVLDNHANEFARHEIKATLEIKGGVLQVRAVRGMLIQILENLVSNSVYWLKQQKRFEPKLKAYIRIVVDPEQDILTVEDNGPGIDPSRRTLIFQPFVSSKPPGEGRGLGLYISEELAKYHDWTLYLEDEEGTVRPNRLSKFVLDFSGAK
jgi:signal transduction histidine kinase